jgi:imidazolonepropionase-like amidohydrolase
MRAATSEAAELLRLEDAGRVAEGGVADLVLYDADPLQDIETVLRPSMVWRAGGTVPGVGSDAT